MHLEVRILKILFQAYYWDCQLQKCWLEFMLLENHWQEDKLQFYYVTTSKNINATQSLHLETPDWWYVFAEYSIISATQR